MKKILYYCSIAAVLSGPGCKKFLDVNHNPNRPEDVQEKLILAPVEYTVARSIAAGNEGGAATFTTHFMQVVCYNQVPPNFGTYFFVNTNLNSTWGSAYTSCLQNLKTLTEKSQDNGNSNYTAIAEVLTAYVLGVTTDLWGDIPYSKALDVLNYTPTYDKQEDIYKTIQSILDQAIADIDKKTGLTPGNDDYFYAGNMTKWRKLAYSLKARYYMHLTKAPGHNAAAQADLALAALQNGMADSTDNWKFVYPGGSTSRNIWYENMLPATTLVASTALVDTLKKRNDPRLPALVAPAKGTGLYTGRSIGAPTTGNINNYSLLGPFYCSVNSAEYIMPFCEVQFIRAEANQIKSGVAAAQPFFTAGITAHMKQLGISQTNIDNYLSSRGTLTANNALEQIMQEKVIADLLSPENYNDWRRTGFPRLTIVPNASTPEIPRRLLYPQSEINANPQPQQPASMVDRIWWDQ